MAGTPIVNPQQRALQLAQVREQFKNDPGILRKMVMGLTEIPHKAWETGEMPSTPEAMRYSLNTLGGLYGTGGAARMAGIGGLTGEGAGMGLPVGRAVTAPWVTKRSYSVPGLAHTIQDTPSGLHLSFETRRAPSGKLHSNLAFRETNPSEPYDTYSGSPAPSMREGLERLNDVFASAETYVNRVKPEVLSFEAGSMALRRLYDRVAPQMAKRLGGRLEKPYSDSYEIHFPEAKQYATPEKLAAKNPKPPPAPLPQSDVAAMSGEGAAPIHSRQFWPSRQEGESLSAHLQNWAEGHGMNVTDVYKAVVEARRQFGNKVNLDHIKQGLLEHHNPFPDPPYGMPPGSVGLD